MFSLYLKLDMILFIYKHQCSIYTLNEYVCSTFLSNTFVLQRFLSSRTCPAILLSLLYSNLQNILVSMYNMPCQPSFSFLTCESTIPPINVIFLLHFSPIS